MKKTESFCIEDLKRETIKSLEKQSKDLIKIKELIKQAVSEGKAQTRVLFKEIENYKVVSIWLDLNKLKYSRDFHDDSVVIKWV